MDVRARSLLIVASASGAVLTLGGIIVWQWLKRNRSKDGHHHHHHGGQQSMFSDVNVWLAYHYAPQSAYDDNIPTTMKDTLDYPVRLAEICKKNKTDGVISRAMDIGCNVGRVCFELATCFEEVIGVDVLEECLSIAEQLRKEGQTPYTVQIEGKIVKEYTALVNPDIDRTRVRFIQADGCDLPSNIGQFGLIVISNTLHHLPDPKEFLENVSNLIVPSGILVISEIYSWHEMMDLPKDRWIAGFTKRNGEDVRGLDGLKDCLSSKFELIEMDDMPTVIRFRPRMYNLAIPQVTIWKKRHD